MKRTIAFVKILALATLLPSFVTLVTIFEKLGLNEQTAKAHVINNVMGNFDNNILSRVEPNEFRIPRAQMLASVITNDKTGAAKELCSWLKEYSKSDEFLQMYKQRRESLKPTTNNAVRPDEETIAMAKESLAYNEKELGQMKKNKSVPAASLKAMEEDVRRQKEQIAEWSDPNPGLTRWNKYYPADPKDLIRKRLQEYLKIVATVDFDAKLTEPDKYGIRKFVNPEYEKKDNRWKAIYRSGREVNSIVTEYVKNWVKEITPSTPAK